MEEIEAEIWADELCTVCKEVFDTEERKSLHRATPKHIQKVKLHMFLAEEMGKNATKSPSRLLERYQFNNVPVVGLNDLVEIQHFGANGRSEKADFWICSICYEAGTTFEQADAHLQSLRHISIFFEENVPEVEAQISAELADPKNQCDRYEAYRAHAEKHYAQNRPLQAPETCRMNMSAMEGRKKFDLNEKCFISFEPRKDDGLKSVMTCTTCNEVFPVHTTGKHSNEKAKYGHCETPTHLRKASIMAILREFNPQEIFEESSTVKPSAELNWSQSANGTWYMSQPCGNRYTYKAGGETMCALCFCLITGELEEHCKSEFHVMKFLPLASSNAAHTVFISQQLRGEQRRAHALHMLQISYSLENDTRRAVALDRFPKFLKEALAEDVHFYGDSVEVVVDQFREKTGKVHLYCQSCATYIEFNENQMDTPEKRSTCWLRHVSGPLHFEVAAVRARININDQFIVPYPPTFSNPDNPVKGEWVMNKDTLIQTQCDVGVEFMVENENDDEVVCQICCQIFSRNGLSAVNTHIRSYDHLKQYIFHKDPPLTNVILGAESAEAKRQKLMDYLQRHSGAFPKRMYVSSRLKALELMQWSPILERSVKKAMEVGSESRDIKEMVLEMVDQVACDGDEKIECSANKALLLAPMLIIHTHRADKELKSLVCKCIWCDLLIVVNSDTWQTDVFTNHVCLEEHHRRFEVRQKNIISILGITPEFSTHTVKQFAQKDPNKKVVWQWNPATKSHEYVATIVGLDDVLEVRYTSDDPISPKKADFYCQLCAKRMPKRAAELETHVREMEHCINYIQKHNPSTFRELHEYVLNQHADKGKELRKYLAGMLKEVNPSTPYCIRVYDPVGEDQRKEMEVILRMQEEEKQRRIKEAQEKIQFEKERLRAELAKKRAAEEERRKVERQKQMEIQQRIAEQERKKQAEREARLQFAKGNVQNFHESADSELQNRLQKASMMERQKTMSHASIDIHQKRLEAERIQLLNKLPGGAKDPQLVILPQLKSKPPLIPQGPPPGIHSRMMSGPVQPYLGYGYTVPPPQAPPPQNPYATDPSGGFSMQFNTRPPVDSPAVRKRPTLRGKQVDPMIYNLTKIANKSDLINYMHSREATAILESEIPREFSQSVQDSPDAFGVDYVAEVICLDEPSLDSYLCTVCNAWASPQGMFRHLCSYEHKSAFLQNKHETYYHEINRERDRTVRRSIFKNFIDDLKRKDIGSVVRLRMNTLIDKATIERLWPGYEDHFRAAGHVTQNWSTGGFQEVSAPSVALPKVVPVVTLIDDDDEEEVVVEKKKDIDERKRKDYRRRDRSRSRDRRRSRTRSRTRSRSRDRDRDYRRRRSSRSRSRSRSRDRRDRSRSRDRHRRTRDRSRSRERSRSRSRESRQPRVNSFSEQTHSFLAQLPKSESKISEREDYATKLSAVKSLTSSGVIQGTRFDGYAETSRNTSAGSTPSVAPVIIDEKRLAKEKAEMEATVRRKTMAAMFMMEKMVEERNGDVPRDAILQMYQSIGLNPEDGDREINKMLDNMRNEKPFQAAPPAAPNINQSLTSLGIQLNRPPYQGPPSYQPAQPPLQQQYGISSSASAYSQAFYAPPITTATTTIPQQQQQPFYQHPPTSIAKEPVAPAPVAAAPAPTSSDSEADDDDEYSEVYALIGKEKKDKEAEAAKLPGQKMALKRTILPSGARVVDEQEIPAKLASPGPSTMTQAPPPQLPPAPTIETSFGMPAPIAVSKPAPPQMHQQPPPAAPVYHQYPGYGAPQQPAPQQQQQYGVVGYGGYPQQAYQPAPQPVQYGQPPQPSYQWPPQQQYAPPPQQPVQYQQYAPAPAPAQQYYAPPTTQAYGIGGQTQPYYYPGR